ncbi:hypothetical protein TGPRC2_270890 [Toxoplasma gondii TgCatPRC2]|uniref:Uncharacterized protein n=1 Tax=Toxoplasma gondii TgCatPRC2 TaxID=1130821 RepID=A0A151HP16_TOXGO|nr:hypothetical protein TGPRC2_270890 [Toxoplasma gondii TgCatPRC2]
MLPTSEAVVGEHQASNAGTYSADNASSMMPCCGGDIRLSVEESEDASGQTEKQLTGQDQGMVATSQTPHLLQGTVGQPSMLPTSIGSGTTNESSDQVPSGCASLCRFLPDTCVSYKCVLPSPQENSIGYRNLELFVSTLLGKCGEAVDRQRRASAMCLFFALHRAISVHNSNLAKWACMRWHASYVMTRWPPKKTRLAILADAISGRSQWPSAQKETLSPALTEVQRNLRTFDKETIRAMACCLLPNSASSPIVSENMSVNGQGSDPSRPSTLSSVPPAEPHYLDSRNASCPLTKGIGCGNMRGNGADATFSDAGAPLRSPAVSPPASEDSLSATKSPNERRSLLHNKGSTPRDSSAFSASRRNNTLLSTRNISLNSSRSGGLLASRSATRGSGAATAVDQVPTELTDLGKGAAPKLPYGQKPRRLRDGGASPLDLSTVSCTSANSHSGKPVREGTRRDRGTAYGRAGISSGSVTSRNSLSGRTNCRSADEYCARSDKREVKKHETVSELSQSDPGPPFFMAAERFAAAATPLISMDYKTLMAAAMCRAAELAGSADSLPTTPRPLN